jgi:hypothetical protein
MSLLQENIVYILLVPVVLQIAIPLAMLIVHAVLFPFCSLFKSKRPSELKVNEKFISRESLA